MENNSKSRVVIYTNARILRGYELVEGEELWVNGPRIIDPGIHENLRATIRDSAKIVDCNGSILCAGFIDLQLNGAFGVDFLTCPDLPAQIIDVCRKLPSTGVTAFCPTLITSPPADFQRVLEQLCPTPPPEVLKPDAPIGASILGAHVEGPFISPKRKGAHPEECIRDFGKHPLETVFEVYGPRLPNIRILTLAPEYEGSEEVIRVLTQRGIVVSLGHSEANLESAERAVQAGATMVTHLFNAMPSFHHRDPSLLGLLLSSELLADSVNGSPRAGSLSSMTTAGSTASPTGGPRESPQVDPSTVASYSPTARSASSVNWQPPAAALARLSSNGEPINIPIEPPAVYFGIICDGIHTHTSAMRMAYRSAPGGLVVVTDGLGALGLPRGDYLLGKTRITVSGTPKTARVTGTETLCGCVATMAYCVRHFRESVKCPVGYALAAATLHPARCLRIESERGTLDPGCVADFLLLDDDLNVLQTFIGGRLVYDQGSSCSSGPASSDEQN